MPEKLAFWGSAPGGGHAEGASPRPAQGQAAVELAPGHTEEARDQGSAG